MKSLRDCSRPISDTELRSSHGKREESTNDLITFLSSAQKLGIDILPITGQSIGVLAGYGRTGQVTQKPINLETSFAFKYLASAQRQEYQDGKLSATEIFQALITEISVLGHPKIRWHANIVELQGVCWDVPSDTEVWPALVFVKSQHGDLNHFINSAIGKNASFKERLALCVDVGTAINDMHSLGIIHGDIKPDNVLIFADPQVAKAFIAKVIDFGYSSHFSNDQDEVLMPRCPPWDAPEYRSICTPAEGRKMDVYSFGMLCLWILFERYLSSAIPLPVQMEWAGQHLPSARLESSTAAFLGSLKSGGKLCLLAEQLLLHSTSASELPVDQRDALQRFFQAALQSDPSKRASELVECFGFFCTRKFPRTPEYNEAMMDVNETPKIVISKDASPKLKLKLKRRPRENITSKDYFQITHLKIPLYQSDFRVRRKIRSLLEQRVKANVSRSPHSQKTDSDDNLAFQLAICCQLGFGGKKDAETSQKLLDETGRSRAQMDEVIAQIHRFSHSSPRHDVEHGRLLFDGYISGRNLSEEYLLDGKLEEAEDQIRQELKGLEDWPTEGSAIKVMLLDCLGSILVSRCQWKEASSLFVQVLEAHEKSGLNNSDMLHSSMQNLASSYREQGLWESAKELDLQRLEVLKTRLGTNHLDTLSSMAALALDCKELGQAKHAEELEARVVELRKERLGESHPDTLDGMSNLASTYGKQDRWEKAERLNFQVRNARMKVHGAEHPRTITSTCNLATAILSQGRYGEAEELYMQATDASSRVQGKKNPETLTCLGNLALAYALQYKLDQSEQLAIQVLESRKEVLGPEHADTLTSMIHLAEIYRVQSRYDQATELLLQAAETQKRILGAADAEILISIQNLAEICSEHGRQDLAEDLRVKLPKTGASSPGMKDQQ